MSTAYIGSTPPAGGSTSTDHHSGWYYIPAMQTVTVAENKQMVVFGTFTYDGTVNIDGQLILEP